MQKQLMYVGMVPIKLETTSLSKFAIVDQITTSLKCSELAIGDIVIKDDHTVVEVHNKHATMALKSLNANDISASIIEALDSFFFVLFRLVYCDYRRSKS